MTESSSAASSRLGPPPRRGWLSALANRLRRAGSSGRAPWIAGLLGVLLASPALTATFTADDHWLRVLGRRDTGIEGLPSRPFDVFVFTDGSPETNHALSDAGVFPWWAAPRVKLAFFRPLSSATHVLDNLLWPESAALQLFHNLAWFALGLLFVWRFYAGFERERWIAVLALAMFAMDDARGPPIGWIANRNTLIALAFAVPVMLLHRRGRSGWRPGLVLAPIVLLVALLAGEAALGILAYVFAYAVFLDRGTRLERFLSLVPYGVLVVAWRLAYVAAGYGAAGSGVYIDMGRNPLLFLGVAVSRWPLLLLGQFGFPFADLANLYGLLGDGIYEAVTLFALLFIVLLALALWPILRRDPVARFYALGLSMAAIPICSTFPSDRLLGFVALGGFGLVAKLIGAWFDESESLWPRVNAHRLAAMMTGAMVFFHLFAGPLLELSRSRSMVTAGAPLAFAERSFLADPEIADKTVVLVNPPGDPFAGYLLITRESMHGVRPRRMRWLTTGASDVRIERLDEQTLRVSPEIGFLAFPHDQLLRGPGMPFSAGDEVELTGVRIRIDELTADGRPKVVTVHFDEPLESSDLVWMKWGERGYERWTPMAVGTTEILPAIDFIRVAFDAPS